MKAILWPAPRPNPWTILSQSPGGLIATVCVTGAEGAEEGAGAAGGRATGALGLENLAAGLAEGLECAEGREGDAGRGILLSSA